MLSRVSRPLTRNSVRTFSSRSSAQTKNSVAFANGTRRLIVARTARTADTETMGMTGWVALAAVAGIAIGTSLVDKNCSHCSSDNLPAEWQDIRKEIVSRLQRSDYDDGSYGPVLIRLAWHASGTYDQASGTGGSHGATMRFSPEKDDPANAGLQVARDLLDPIKKNHPNVSYADLWTFAGKVAIEESGGPTIPWRPGRKDAPDGRCCPPGGRLPDASQGARHVRDIFYRMGLNDQEIVALIGAHAYGRCHRDRSGYEGPWTRSPTMFSNDFFVQLKNSKWTKKVWNGPEQFEDETGELMMTPADLAFLNDPQFRKWVDIYAADEDRFAQDFAKAFGKLLDFGKW